MGFVLHLLVFLCFVTCLCITKQSARLICASKSVEGPDVPLQNTKTKSSPDDYSKAPGVEVHAYTYSNTYSQTGFVSIFVVCLCLSFHSQQGPQLLLAHTPLMTGYWDCFVGTSQHLLSLPTGLQQSVLQKPGSSPRRAESAGSRESAGTEGALGLSHSVPRQPSRVQIPQPIPSLPPHSSSTDSYRFALDLRQHRRPRGQFQHLPLIRNPSALQSLCFVSRMLNPL